MKKLLKRSCILCLVLLMAMVLALPALAAGGTDAAAQSEAASEASTTNWKAVASALAIGIASVGGAVSMGMATGKATEGISRQPEAEGKIRTTLMLGLVFIETAIIYALLAVILIIFVL